MSTTDTAHSTPVTVLGLGPMGRALAHALLRAGHPTTVWNRTPEKAGELVQAGAVLASSAANAAAASPLTLVCVIDYDAVHAIVEPAAGALAGRTLVNLAADTPPRARETAAWAEEHGIAYLDGAIMTPTETIGSDAALVLYSGPRDRYDAHLPTLSSLGGRAVYLGEDHGRAAAHDVALLDLFWTSMSGMVHAFALARAEGVSGTDIAPFMGGIAELLPAIAVQFGEQIDAGAHPGADSTIASAAAGMEHIVRAAEQRGLDTTVLSAALALARRAIAAGHAEDSFSRLAETVEAAHAGAVSSSTT
jgi:3-hydroxyisobutyrate dehydrogenase-like beta-hydroxyacid dehydrogenase